MKKRYLPFLILLFCGSFSLFGQSINRQYALDYSSLLSGISLNNEGRMLVAGYEGNRFANLYVGFVESENDEYLDVSVLFEFDEVYGGVINISNIAHDTTDNYSYFAIARDGCDVALSDKLFRISTQPFQYEVITMPNAAFGVKYELAVLPGQGVLIGNRTTTLGSGVWLYQEGEFYQQFAFQNILSLAARPEGTFAYLDGENLSVAQLDLTTRTSTVLHSDSLTDAIAVEWVSDDQLVILDSMGIELFDLELNSIQRLTYDTPRELTIDETYIYILAEDGIHVLDHSLVEQSLIPQVELANYVTLASTAAEGQVYYVGTSEARRNIGFRNSVKLPSDMFIRSFTIDGEDTPANTNVVIESVTHTPAEVVLTPPYCMNAEVSNMEAIISNQGTEVIEEVVLTLSLPGCGDGLSCEHWIDQHWVRYVDLAPGEATLINMGTINIYHTRKSEELGLCLKVFPNGETLETNLLDNYVCGIVQDVVADREITQVPDFQVYPTIFDDQLIVTLPELYGNYGRIVIYDLTGQTVKTIAFTETSEYFSLEVSDLPAGSYYVRLEGRQMSQAVKIIKH